MHRIVNFHITDVLFCYRFILWNYWPHFRDLSLCYFVTGRSYADAVESGGDVWVTGGWDGKVRHQSSEVIAIKMILRVTMTILRVTMMILRVIMMILRLIMMLLRVIIILRVTMIMMKIESCLSPGAGKGRLLAQWWGSSVRNPNFLHFIAKRILLLENIYIQRYSNMNHFK